MPENPDTLYLKVLGIPPSPNRTISKKIDLYNYYENDAEDKEKWWVDSDGGVGTFLNEIVDEKEFDNNIKNPVSLGG